MYRKQYVVIFVLVALGIVAAGFFAFSNDKAPTTQETITTETNAVAEQSPLAIPKQEEVITPGWRPVKEKSVAPHAQTVTLSVGTSSYETLWREKMAVIDAMDALKHTGALSFSAKEFSGLGMFVEEIAGKKNGDGFYWILYVNGEKSAKGASQTVLALGDYIEWRYEGY